jgi:hypothetical protein
VEDAIPVAVGKCCCTCRGAFHTSMILPFSMLPALIFILDAPIKSCGRHTALRMSIMVPPRPPAHPRGDTRPNRFPSGASIFDHALIVGIIRKRDNPATKLDCPLSCFIHILNVEGQPSRTHVCGGTFPDSSRLLPLVVPTEKVA